MLLKVSEHTLKIISLGLSAGLKITELAVASREIAAMEWEELKELITESESKLQNRK